MIVKEKEYSNSNDPRIKAGDEAEQKMAFYLRRAFADNPDIFIFNDVHFTYNGEGGQIDHLILYKHGFINIESKSVMGTIKIQEANGLFEWYREDYKKGMPSPIQQANRQLDLFKKVLNYYSPKITSSGKQDVFSDTYLDVLVAISDTGIIKPNSIREKIPEVHKADNIPDIINDIIKKRTPKLFDINIPIYLTEESLKKISAFIKNDCKLEKSIPVSQGITQADMDAFFNKKEEIKQESKPTLELEQSIPKCPKCGADMKLRTNANPPFYGCSMYSKTDCKGKRDEKTLSEI